MRATKTVETWRCPRCDYTYDAPTHLVGIEHRCTKAPVGQRVVVLRKVKVTS